MHLKDHDFGDFRIYTAATISPRGGYTAAVAVSRLRGIDNPPQRLYSDYAIADGFRFSDPKAALAHAFEVGHRQLRQHMMATA